MSKVTEIDFELRLQESYQKGKKDAREELLKVVKPFLECVKKSDGRIPTEKLSFNDWDKLCKAFVGVSSKELSK